MSVRAICDGCGKVEEPRREDICELKFDLGESVTVIRDYCAECETKIVGKLKQVLEER